MTRTLTLLPFMLLLFVLPFPGTVALRLVCLAVAFLVAIALWRRLAPPAIPCKPALLAWMAVAFLSLACFLTRPIPKHRPCRNRMRGDVKRFKGLRFRAGRDSVRVLSFFRHPVYRRPRSR